MNILKVEKKFFLRAYNNLAILVFYCRLQLIQYFLTNSLVPPLPRSPTNLEGWKFIGVSLEELQLAGAKKLEKKYSEWRNLSTDVIPMR